MEKVEPGIPPGEDLQHLFDTLQHLTEALEAGNLSLEESVKTFEEATAIGNRIKEILDKADKTVMVLSEGNEYPFYDDK